MILVITTQYSENYGNADQPYWKAKGSCDYKIKNIPTNLPGEQYENIVRLAEFDYSNDFSEEYVIGWDIRDDEYHPDFGFDGEKDYNKIAEEWAL
jgi:hypothetical protein